MLRFTAQTYAAQSIWRTSAVLRRPSSATPHNTRNASSSSRGIKDNDLARNCRLALRPALPVSQKSSGNEWDNQPGE